MKKIVSFIAVAIFYLLLFLCLQMDGFFTNNVAPNTIFAKPATGLQPNIDLTALP